MGGVSETADDLRRRMLEAAEHLLAASPDFDVATRAVCDAVGVGQPVLYRMFGDKAGLLAALADHGFEKYVERKRGLGISDDPVADLRTGWDQHIEYARANPAMYRLMFSPTLARQPEAPRTIFGLLLSTLERCAAKGLLVLPPAQAAQMLLSATIGVGLAVLVRPDVYTDPSLSDRVREAVLSACLTESARTSQDGDTTMASTAVQLAEQLRGAPVPTLGGEERQLLVKWLDTIAAG